MDAISGDFTDEQIDESQNTSTDDERLPVEEIPPQEEPGDDEGKG